MTGRPRKVQDGKCAACAQYHHCSKCVCCDGIVRDGSGVQGTAYTATLAVITCAGTCGHTHHYTRRNRTHRIPDGGKVRLSWRDRLTAGTAPIARVSNNPRVQRFVAERLTRAHMQSACRG